MYNMPSEGFLCRATDDITDEVLLQTISVFASRVFYIDWASELLTPAPPDGKITLEMLHVLAKQTVKDVRESRGI